MTNVIQNLIFLYHTMVASENLLIVAADQASGELKEYLLEHREEERGHAHWLAEDLKSIGITVQDMPIPRDVLEMVGSIYYLIFHVDPASLLGYMQVMEQPVPIAEVERLEAQHSPSLLRTLRYHAEHDPQHYIDLLAIIQTLAPYRQSLVAETAQRTADYWRRAFPS